MSTKSNDGGPAFPQTLIVNPLGTVERPGAHFTEVEGITIRDYFAAKAMAALLLHTDSKNPYVQGVKDITTRSYEVADSMLNAREKQD